MLSLPRSLNKKVHPSRRQSWLALAFLANACAHDSERELGQRARRFAEEVSTGDRSQAGMFIEPSQRAEVDYEELFGLQNSKPLPSDIESENGIDWTAMIDLGSNDMVQVKKAEKGGWRFSQDPTLYYSQASPRQTMRSWVLSTLHQRWDILLELAPQRYRAAMNVEDLKTQWTTGKDAIALRAIRDRVAKNLHIWIDEDAHQAYADLGDGLQILFEREGSRWVIASF